MTTPRDRADQPEPASRDRLVEAVRRMVERAPALDAEQVERLRGLLPAPQRRRRRGADAA